MKGRWGLDQGKIAWLPDRIWLVTHTVPTWAQAAHQGHTRQEAMEHTTMTVCVLRTQEEMCHLLLLPQEILGCIQDANSRDSMINKMYHIHTDTHIFTQTATEALEKTLQICLGNCSALAEKISVFFHFGTKKQTTTHLPSSFHQGKIPSVCFRGKF